MHEPYPISEQNSCKNIPFGAAHTYIAYIRDYPHGAKNALQIMSLTQARLMSPAKPQRRGRKRENKPKNSERSAHFLTGFFAVITRRKLTNLIEMAMIVARRFINSDRHDFDFVGNTHTEVL